MSTTASSAPRKLTRKGQATRSRILDAAATLMYERGVALTSIEDVKAAADVSSSQLYHYFADKQTLVSAVISRQSELVLAFQEPHLIKVDDLDALRDWRDAIVEVVEARGGAGGCPLGSLASELSEGDASQRVALSESFDRWEAAIRQGLERMRDRNALSPEADPQRLAMAMLAALQGGLLLSQVRRTTAPMRAALDEMIARIAAASA